MSTGVVANSDETQYLFGETLSYFDFPRVVEYESEGYLIVRFIGESHLKTLDLQGALRSGVASNDEQSLPGRTSSGNGLRYTAIAQSLGSPHPDPDSQA
ncbi:hypothetical protein GP486_004173 [Trichoglossum hirsutum]|uniref:Uncharacterized protein n=1 Tax=Trichoglossum hirsutum TaxID=265104 RepID=A0A9P8LBG9_9PEZI|nr:hypothetical protein GP486_004173 [Trichoglossum hirsutum]